MIVSCEKQVLQSACTVAMRATASKSPIKALEGLLLEAKDSSLKITGYNLREGIYTKTEADVKENGSVVLEARFISEMLRRFPDGILTITSDENDNVTVKCGRSKIEFMGFSAEDYPEIPAVDELRSIVLPQKLLRSMINQSIFAVSDSDIRPIYTGSLFEIEGDLLTVVSVDGYRLAKRTEKLEGAQMDNCEFVVPGAALNDIERICTDEEGDVTISVGEKHIAFIIGETVVISRRLEGTFLNYRKSIPDAFKYEVKVERSEFMSSIERVALVITEKNNSPIRMRFEDGNVDCRCLTSMGSAEDICVCEGNGENTEIGFNEKYMMDALKAAAKDEILICFNTPSAPCIIKAADGTENFTYMILPMRLRAGD